MFSWAIVRGYFAVPSSSAMVGQPFCRTKEEICSDGFPLFASWQGVHGNADE